MKKEFNQQEYINDFNQKTYVNISFRIREDKKKEFNTLIKRNGFKSYNDFITKCIEIMKSENNNIKK